MTWLPYVSEDVDAIAAAMDLRKPNAEALGVLAEKVAAGDGGEYVADLATGVGKTYLAAGLVDYLAQQGARNVLIVVPSAAILAKTIENFTPGAPKYVAGAQVEPVVITSDNFARGSVGDVLHDPRKLKLFIFTVQTLISPTLKATRKTHEENEVIGDALYAHLQNADDLVVIVDEHHVIREKAKRFNAAVHELGARAVVGLTATPDKASEKNIVYRYPLAAAIADGLVKIPTVVFRTDGRKDLETQLADACQLRRLKEPHWATYAAAAGARPVHPVIFVVCERIEEAHDVATQLRSADKLPGAGEVLVITGESKDADLQALADIERPDSPVRAVVSVDKLKEGWDVSNIGVILATRRLASETLTEQVLGRGLRLPFGKRAGVPAIDQVDIVAHESYKRLLAQKDALLERVAPPVPENDDTAKPEKSGTLDFSLLVEHAENGTEEGTEEGFAISGGGDDDETLDGTSIADLLLAREMGAVERGAERPTVDNTMPRNDLPPIVFPAQAMASAEPVRFSLTSVSTETMAARGAAFRSDPAVKLNRVALNVERVLDGGVVVRTETADDVDATSVVLSGAEIRQQLTGRMMSSSLVEVNLEELGRAGELVAAFLAGAGIDDDQDTGWEWSVAQAERAISELTSLIRTARAGQIAGRTVTYTLTPVKVPVPRERPNAPRTVWDEFVKGAWVGPMKRSIDRYAAFDSKSAELVLAQTIDSAREVERWNRVYTHTPTFIFWGGGRRYYVDFVVVTSDGHHWAIEAKADKDATDSIEVQQKREAAERWIEQVNSSLQFGTWHYLFLTETDIKQAGDWAQLTARGAL